MGVAERARQAEYMEALGGYSCGRCRFREPTQPSDDLGVNPRTGMPLVYCAHPKVRQPVDPTYGCCRLFEPQEGLLILDARRPA